MRSITVFTRKHKDKVWFSLFINAVLLTFLLIIFRPSYETNDDMGLCSIVNGAYGTFDAHMIYANYLLGLILSGLYKMTQALPWYALVQYAALFAAFTALTVVLLRRSETMAARFLGFSILLCFSYEGYIRLQYTKTAGILTVAGVFLMFYALCTEKRNMRALVCGMAIACFGAMYRLPQFFTGAFLMTGIGLFQLFQLGGRGKKEFWKRAGSYVGAFAILLLLVIGLYGVDRLSYQSEGWQKYESYNEARTELFDYGFPGFEKNQEEYEKLGIDSTAYRMLRGWNHMDTEKFTEEIMEKIVGMRTPKQINLSFLKNFCRKVILQFFTVPVFWCFLLVFLFWLLLCRHRWTDVTVFLYECFAVGILYFYLFYRGRYLRNRVDVPIWLAASLVLFWVLPVVQRLWAKWAVPVFLAGVLILTHGTWEKRLRVNTAAEPQKREAYREVLEYLAADKEHLYITRSGAVSLMSSYGIFESIPAGIVENTLSLGGWPANTPGYVARMEKYGITNPFRDMIGNEQIYLVDGKIEEMMEYLHTYYDGDAEAVQVAEPGNAKIYKIE